MKETKNQGKREKRAERARGKGHTKHWSHALIPTTDSAALAVLAVVSVLVRLPFLKYFDLVSFDGTYYINQARALARVVFSGVEMPGQFPIGYPFFISILLPFFPDDVVAAQVVSFVASLGSIVVLFYIAKLYLPRHLAFYCAGFLALTPLFIRLSLMTMSEATYTCWVLVALLLYARRRDFPAGIAAGVAAVTRPEMLAVAGLLALGRVRVPRRAAMLLAGFTIVFAINVGVMYRATGRVVLLQKTANLGMRAAQTWVDLEQTVDEATGSAVARRASPAAIAASYARELPSDGWTLLRHCALVLLLFAVYGAIRRPTFVLVALVPFFAIPLFAPRGFERFFLPYVPIIVLYAFIGADQLRTPRLRHAAMVVMAGALIAGAAWNRGQLTTPVGDGFAVTKEAGLALRDRVRPGDRLADRKPYTAFYAGARYVEIPFGSYNETMEYLVDNNVRFLSLFVNVIKAVRPVLTPLLTDEAAIRGELRYSQTYFHPSGLCVYERTGQVGGLVWTRLTRSETGRVATPSWSPDGYRIAFVRKDDDDSTIYRMPADGGSPPKAVVRTSGYDDYPAWSRDGRRLAFSSTVSGDWEVYVLDLTTNQARQITNHPGPDGAPTWLADDTGLIYASAGGGGTDLWHTDLSSGATTRLTSDGRQNFPAVSPSGRRVASVALGRGVQIMDLETGATVTARGPRNVQFAPTWSPDETFIAVTANDWGSVDVYLLTADGESNILLTKNTSADSLTWYDGHPAWSPDGKRLALISNHEGSTELYLLEGLEDYCERLLNPVDVGRFDLGRQKQP